MNHTVKTLALSGLCFRYPADYPVRLHRSHADLLLGLELAIRVYSPLAKEGKNALRIVCASLVGRSEQTDFEFSLLSSTVLAHSAVIISERN